MMELEAIDASKVMDFVDEYQLRWKERLIEILLFDVGLIFFVAVEALLWLAVAPV